MAEYKVNFRIRVSYRNRGLRCFRMSFYDFLENLGEGFEDKGVEYERGKLSVSYGDYLENTRIRIFHTNKVLHGVSIDYNGDDPKGDLKDLEEYFETVGLVRKKNPRIKVNRSEVKNS